MIRKRLAPPLALLGLLVIVGSVSALSINVHNAPTDREVQVDLKATDIAAILSAGQPGGVTLVSAQSDKWLRVTRLTWMLTPGSEMFGYVGGPIYFRVGEDLSPECPAIDGTEWAELLFHDQDYAGTIELSAVSECPTYALRGQALKVWANAPASNITGNGTLRLLVQYQAVSVP